MTKLVRPMSVKEGTEGNSATLKSCSPNYPQGTRLFNLFRKGIFVTADLHCYSTLYFADCRYSGLSPERIHLTAPLVCFAASRQPKKRADGMGRCRATAGGR